MTGWRRLLLLSLPTGRRPLLLLVGRLLLLPLPSGRRPLPRLTLPWALLHRLRWSPLLLRGLLRLPSRSGRGTLLSLLLLRRLLLLHLRLGWLCLFLFLSRLLLRRQ